MNALGQDLEEPLHNAMPLFGIYLFGQTHRPLHTGEEYRDLLALAFEGRPRRQDLLSEVLGRVGAGIGSLSHRAGANWLATLEAELSFKRQLYSALTTPR